MKGTQRKHLCFFTACCLLAMLLFPALTPSAQAAAVPEAAVTVWDMENLPEDLFESNWALGANGFYHAYSDGKIRATRAEGSGVDGSVAVALTYTEQMTSADFWGCGFYLRICEDETADPAWLGVREIWFWMDASEFENSQLVLDFMVDGVRLKHDAVCTLISNGREQTITAQTVSNGNPFGRLTLPQGFCGWLGLPAEDFNTTFGTIQNISLTYSAQGDEMNFPLSLYVDEFRIIREDRSDSALFGDGDLFNKDVPVGEHQLYTDLTQVHQKVVSFGASGAWWANAGGTSDFVDEALRLVFTDEGAGLNNYRHNVGGSVKEDRSDAGTMMQAAAAVPSPLTEDGRYDEKKDLGGYTVLMKLVDLGTIDDFTLFMNTPPATMTKNGMTYGDPWGETLSNLREDCYEAYASYVVDMVQLYNYLGVPVSYVSPVNEPQYDWTGGTQEGCHYTADEVRELIELISQELTRRCEDDPTLSDVKISFAESGTWIDKSYTNYLYLKLLGNPEATDKYAHIGCHSYGTDADAKERVAREMRNMGAIITFRQTEYGPTWETPDFTVKTAVEVGRVMYEDLTILSVDSWAYWLACANGNYTDGLVYVNTDSTVVQPTKRLWAMGQYARFLKGATRVGVDEYGMPSGVCASAYVNRAQDSLVYVLVNTKNEDQSFSFAGLPAGSTAEVYETSAIRDLELRGTMTSDSGYVLPGLSVTTFVFHGMDLPAVASGSHPDNPMGFTAKEDFDYGVFDREETGDPAVPETEETTPAETEPTAPKTFSLPKWALPVGGGVLGVGILGIAIVLLRKKKQN